MQTSCNMLAGGRICFRVFQRESSRCSPLARQGCQGRAHGSVYRDPAGNCGGIQTASYLLRRSETNQLQSRPLLSEMVLAHSRVATVWTWHIGKHCSSHGRYIVHQCCSKLWSCSSARDCNCPPCCRGSAIQHTSILNTKGDFDC